MDSVTLYNGVTDSSTLQEIFSSVSKFNLRRLRSVMLSPNLMKKHAKLRYHPLSQGIRTIKTLSQYKKSY